MSRIRQNDLICSPELIIDKKSSAAQIGGYCTPSDDGASQSVTKPQSQGVRSDRLAGVEAACEQVMQLRDSGTFDGVHLIPVGRYREIAARLEQFR